MEEREEMMKLLCVSSKDKIIIFLKKEQKVGTEKCKRATWVVFDVFLRLK